MSEPIDEDDPVNTGEIYVRDSDPDLPDPRAHTYLTISQTRRRQQGEIEWD